VTDKIASWVSLCEWSRAHIFLVHLSPFDHQFRAKEFNPDYSWVLLHIDPRRRKLQE